MPEKDRENAVTNTNPEESHPPDSPAPPQDANGISEKSSADPVQQVQPSFEVMEKALMLQQFSALLAKVYRAMTTWLTHEQKHLRVLGWITWIVLLLMPVAVVVVLLLNWTVVATVVTVAGLSGLVGLSSSLTSTLVRRFKRGPDSD